MRNKNILDSPFFWKGLIIAIFLVIIIGISCALIFYAKIFEKWDRAKVIKLEDYNGYSALATYVVDGEEYEQWVGRTLNNQSNGGWLHKAWAGETELYISYLVSNPTYILPHNVRRDAIIVLSLLWFSFVVFGILTFVKLNNGRKKDGTNYETQ